MKRWLIVAAVLVVAILGIVVWRMLRATPSRSRLGPKNADGFTDITVEQLVSLMEQGDITLVNVHIPFEGDLPDTDLSIPYNEILDHLDELPGKDETIVLYCRSGSMSEAAARDLVPLGYNNILELDGGMIAWGRAGHELVFP